MATAPVARVRRAILILLPILLALGVGYWWWSRPAYVVFAQGLRPADAAAVVAELDKRGTPYRLNSGGGTILVPADRADDTRVALAGSDLAARGVVGFELFNESDMGLTNFAQKINYQRALQGELTRTLLAMDGVEHARVHLALPEKSLFRGERAEASAAVAIEMKQGAVLDPARVAGIQRLVAAAAIDLPEARVIVLDGAGRQISSNGAVGGSQAPDEREAIRTLFAARADAAIAPVLPGARVTVRIAEEGPVSWDGGERTFPLEVQVVTPRAVSAEKQQRVAAALAIDPARGDQLHFVSGQAAPVALPVPTFAPSATGPVTDIERVEAPASWPWILALLALAGVALIAVVRRRQRPALDDGAQDAFALRLRHAMDGGDARG